MEDNYMLDEIKSILNKYKDVDCGEKLVGKLVDVLNSEEATFYNAVDALSYIVISIADAHKNKDVSIVDATTQLLKELSAITTNKIIDYDNSLKNIH